MSWASLALFCLSSSAQASADELKQNSAKEAQLILHEAELKGRQLVNEAYSERQGIEQSMADLKSAEQDFRFKFRQLLEGYLKHLEDAPAGVAVAPAQGIAQAEFARHAEAIKEAIAREEVLAPAESPAAPEQTAEPPAAPAVTVEVPATEVDDTELPDAALAALAEEEPPEYSIDTAPAPAPDLPTEPGPDAAERPPARERILFGETDDLLADVDSGVNAVSYTHLRAHETR